jgi:DNA-binding transcriptional MerR regulator
MRTTQEVLDQTGASYRILDVWTTSQYLSDDPKRVGNGQRRTYTDDEVRVFERMLALVQAGMKPEVASVIARGDIVAYNKIAQALEDC